MYLIKSTECVHYNNVIPTSNFAQNVRLGDHASITEVNTNATQMENKNQTYSQVTFTGDSLKSLFCLFMGFLVQEKNTSGVMTELW